MVNRYEDICIFSKQGYDYCGENPLRGYFTKVFEFIGKTKKEIMNEVGQRADHCFRLKSPQFSLPTNETYEALITAYNIDKMPDFVEYSELKKIQNDYTQKYASVFNLWEGNKSKSNVLEYKKENSGYHPTQKPVLLLEDLIKTYSNEGDVVLDFTMGSGSTGVACKNTNREFIGMELDENYYKIACERLGAQKE
jgi:site-specific DNA-methyltransferase (adenine-specific)